MAGTDFSHLTSDELIKGIQSLNIPEYIRSKSHGVDVRETLAQMTEMLMQLAYNQGMNPQQAQEFVYRINNKINKGEVSMTDLSQEVKEALTGGAVAVVGVDAVASENIKNSAVTTNKLANDSVSATKTDFIETSSNLVNFSKITDKQVISQTGTVSSNISYGFTDYIRVSPQDEVSTAGIGSLAIYDISKTFITRLGDNSSFESLSWTIPNGGYFARGNFRSGIGYPYYTDKTIQLNISPILLPFETYSSKLDDIEVDGTDISVNSITNNAYADKSISADKTNFIKTSSNIFNHKKVSENKVISADGVVTSNDSYFTSEPIHTYFGEEIHTVGVHSIAYFDENDNFIRRLNLDENGTSSAVSPSGSTYFIANIYEYAAGNHWKDGKVQINRDTLKNFEYFFKTLSEDIRIETDGFVNNSSNLINLKTAKHGYLINASGIEIENSGYLTFEPINVQGGESISTLGIMYIAFYGDGNFIQRVSANEGNIANLMVPSSATTAIPMATYYNANVVDRTVRINRGSLVDYEPFYKEIEATGFSYKKTLRDFKEQNILIPQIKLSDLYTAEPVPTKKDMVNYSVAEQYAYFDGLMNSHSDYITKANYGKDTSGNYDVNVYTFSAPQVPKVENNRPKLIVIAGNHGYEKTHPYILYHAMKQIAENWENSELLEYLRFNVDIVVMPASNPHSWSGNSRGNVNDVDISRNFEYRWINADPPTGFNRGTSPLSEIESQYIDRLLQDNSDAVFFTSLHNFETVEANPEQFIWVAAADDFSENLGQSLIDALSRKWKKQYEWLPKDKYFGFVDDKQPFGAEGHQANLYGIQGGTFELSDIFRLEPNAEYDSEIVLTLGVETLINYLYLNAVYGSQYYNAHGKDTNKYDPNSFAE